MVLSCLLAALYLVEMLSLFAIWAWRLRSRSVVRLIGGGAMLYALLAIPILSPAAFAGRAMLGMMGVYLASALMWACRFDGLAPARWGLGETVVAVGATALTVASFAMV